VHPGLSWSLCSGLLHRWLGRRQFRQFLAKAVQLFGEPLSEEHRVYRLNDNYVLWLILDTQGELFEVDAGPKSYYSTEFPNVNKSPELDRISKVEYEDALQKISTTQGHRGASRATFWSSSKWFWTAEHGPIP
jgi:hypothetical protein